MRQPDRHALDLAGLERMLAADRFDAVERRLDLRAGGPLFDIISVSAIS